MDKVRTTDRQAVVNCLRDDPAIDGVLSQAIARIPEFIPDARFSLSWQPDPKHGVGGILFLGVMADLDESLALDALKRFDRAWWIPNAGRTRTEICIDLSAT
ncbi:MAG: hypothetical protein EPO26_15360 [Chloroflexota bacterium]|nr:MAG: hypothetical protein EPO26_15360 [Chloroflexota bacterium]